MSRGQDSLGQTPNSLSFFSFSPSLSLALSSYLSSPPSLSPKRRGLLFYNEGVRGCGWPQTVYVHV